MYKRMKMVKKRPKPPLRDCDHPVLYLRRHFLILKDLKAYPSFM